jgi:multidrug efflux pump subunit AcrA (membrane-fusion protein)
MMQRICSSHSESPYQGLKSPFVSCCGHVAPALGLYTEELDEQHGIPSIVSTILAAVIVVVAPETCAQPAPVTVQVAEVQTADVPFILEGIGTAQAFNTVTVRAQVDGTPQQIHFTEGQPVRKGEVLAQIDPRTYQAALDHAVA